ncbi:hypothetical protein [Polyangium spumosum]|uniref:Neutral/alkaline non-lysosomal ceramidase N-terminal domain-containing protein n=1 Tax=Polyangium spumosum TaxID=889282 RepID=A0A6N7PXI4_9BACT|nr:hypothetical protein [Polyangium spumosum]MRG95566.1 hypothetical protein [Polyangium spumosum]
MRSLRSPFSLLVASILAPALAGCGGGETKEPPAATPTPIVDAQGRATNLNCPGAVGCEKAEGDLRVGASAQKITPTIETWTDTNQNGEWDEGEAYEDKNGNGRWDGVWLAGFGNGRAATGVHDDVWARVVVLEQGDVSVGMVSLDLVGYFQEYVLDIRQAAAAEGLDFDHVLVASTHVHEARDTMGMWGRDPSTSGIDPAYMDHIVKQTVLALKEAKAAQKKAKLVVAQAQAPELVNDTRRPFVIDQNITTLQFQDESGAVMTNMVFWGNHPEALGSKNTLLTSDYPHYLRETMEAKWPGAPTVFFSGLLGGLTTTIGIVGCPDFAGMETCEQGTWERAEYVGKGAAEAAIAALEGGSTVKDDAPSLAFRRRSFLLPATNISLGIAVLSGLMPREVYWWDGKRVTEAERPGLGAGLLLSGDVVIASEVNGIHIGPVAIATAPGELYTELWLLTPGGSSYIESPDGADYPDALAEVPVQSVLPEGSIKVMVNNANDAIGYVIPLPQWDQVPPYDYVADDDQYGEENSSGYQAGPIITQEFVKMYAE